MDHAHTAHVAAVAGAVGAPLVLVAGRRSTLLGGLTLLAAAEAGLVLANSSSHGGVRLATLALLAAGLVPVAALAALFRRFPLLMIPAMLVAAPFRLPLDFGRQHRLYVAIAHSGQLGRLLPLYVVLAAAAAALVYGLARGEPVRPLPRELALPAGAFLAFASSSLLWSEDLHAGTSLLAFFLLPFALLLAVGGRATFDEHLPRVLAVIAVSLASAFAAFGLWEAATHRLLFYAPKIEVANQYTSYFRVTSLFRDPSLYGRHLVLGIVVVLVTLLTGRLTATAAIPLIALMWAGLFFSYSQSSLAALFVAVAAIGAVMGDRRTRIGLAVGAAAIVVVGAVLVAATAANHSSRKATSGRTHRVEVTARVFEQHPIVGVGIGAQPLASQKRAGRSGSTQNFVSHTTPLTVAAELGVLGLALYVILLAGAARLLTSVWRRDAAVGLALGAVFLALFVHSLAYSGFLEDPITWLVLAIAAVLVQAVASDAEAVRRPAPPVREPLAAG